MNTIHQKSYRKIKDLKCCEKCGIEKKLIRHHYDYNKPLEVNIFCQKCHYEWHQNNKAINIPNNVTSTIRFKGNKEQLHKQLKKWCEEADRTMNGTILELIEKHLEEKFL